MRLKTTFLPLLIIVCTALSLVQAQNSKRKRQPKSPCGNALNQTDMNQCFCDEYRKSDAELNRVYQQLLKANQDDPVRTEKVKAAQRAWITFRDAQMEAFYPTTGEDPKLTYGSVYHMCYCLDEKALTEDRIRQMKAILNSKEGDVCG